MRPSPNTIGKETALPAHVCSCRVATSAGTAGERDRFARLPAGGANTAMATLDPAYKLTKDRSVCLEKLYILNDSFTGRVPKEFVATI